MSEYTENIEDGSYQTLKLLPLVSSGDVGDQLILVSEDGTILNSNEYVMQVVEDEREVESVEQYYADCPPLVVQESQNYEYIADNSKEYGPVNEATEATKADNTTVVQANNGTVDSSFQSIKELTQLTLTEAQCRLLEEKGQVLVEHGARSFLLNANGLQDITDNPELILTLQSEHDSLQESNRIMSPKDLENNHNSEEGPVEKMEIEPQGPCLPTTKHDVNSPNDDGNIKIETPITDISTENETHESSSAVSTELQSVPSQFQFVLVNETCPPPLKIVDSKSKSNAVRLVGSNKKFTLNESASANSLVPNVKSVHKPESSRIKIKANIDIKDVPEKMFIGHSASGKKLYARAVEVKCARAPNSEGAADTPHDVMQLNRNFEKLSSAPGKLNGSLLLLLEKHIRSKRESWTCSVEEVAYARRTVQRLLGLPAARPQLLSRYLIITMMVHKVTNDSTDVKMLQCMITGRVQQDQTDKEMWSFKYMPDIDLSGARDHSKDKTKKASKRDSKKNVKESDMFEGDAEKAKRDEMKPEGDKMKSEEGEEVKPKGDETMPEEPQEATESIPDSAKPSSVLHLHIIETVQPPLPNIVNIVFLHRRLPIGRERGVRHACAFCAKVFFSMVTLYEHQLSCAPKSKRKPPIAAPQAHAVDPFSDATSLSDSTRCPICNLRFRRKLTYERHLLSHFGPDFNERPTADGALYTCNMCPKTCTRASTLTRHIMNTHIGPNS